MCITIEATHFQQLRRDVHKKIAKLRQEAKGRSKDFLLSLDPLIAEAAIIFRDFPKVHGALIQSAVGTALEGHEGGYSETAKRFSFLSGLTTEVDNFFMDRRGAIFLIETKRSYGNVREDGVAARNLFPVADFISKSVIERTGRPLRYDVQCCYFSYADELPLEKRQVKINIGTKNSPRMVFMPVLSRSEMNDMIGSCFGEYLRLFDDLVGRAVSIAAPEVFVREERRVENNFLVAVTQTQGLIRVGGETPSYPREEGAVLAPL